MAVEVEGSCKDACQTAKRYAKGGWKGVKVEKLTTPRQVANAETQVEKIADWSSDHEIRE
jgi:hypothetical protein